METTRKANQQESEAAFMLAEAVVRYAIGREQLQIVTAALMLAPALLALATGVVAKEAFMAATDRNFDTVKQLFDEQKGTIQ